MYIMSNLRRNRKGVRTMPDLPLLYRLLMPFLQKASLVSIRL